MSRQVRLCVGLCAFAVLLANLPAFAHGDKVIPYVPNGVNDGKTYRTKLDITNLGPDQNVRIRNVRVLFFQRNGQPWTVQTNLGNVSEIPLDLGKFQTLRIETQGTGPLLDGYAIVRSTEGTTVYAEDYEPAITAFYEVRDAQGVIDTVSVPVGQPTRAWVFPSQTEPANNLYTGFAIVNLSDQTNAVELNGWEATSPASGSATSVATIALTPALAPREMRVAFMHQLGFRAFKGMVLGSSDQPVAVLALLQAATASAGVQYATMVSAYADALRRNTTIYLREGYPLDADLPVSDYYWTPDMQFPDTLPWDVLYEAASGTRRLTPQSGATVALIGQRTISEFDNNVTLPYLQGLSYSTTPIDLRDGSANLTSGWTFAIRTGLGRYVKLRIADVIERGTERDLALELYIYK